MADPIDIVEEADLGIATVMARKGQGAELVAAIEAAYGLTLPAEPRRAAHGDVAFIGTGPGAWLAIRRGGALDWAPELSAALAGLASVVDQSSGQLVLRLSGTRTADLLSKGVFIDLHPAAFPPGAAAATALGHLSVLIWREDRETFGLAIARSYAASLRHWLASALSGLGAGR